MYFQAYLFCRECNIPILDLNKITARQILCYLLEKELKDEQNDNLDKIMNTGEKVTEEEFNQKFGVKE